MSASFHLGDLLSITTGRLLSPTHMDGIYRICDYVTGVNHLSHQLPRAADAIRPWLLNQHPWLSAVAVPDDIKDQPDLMAWLSHVVIEHGEFHDVEPMPPAQYVGRDPMEELIEMVGPERVIPVVIDPEGGAR